MQDIIIIAEAGVNHNGSIELAKQLIDVAANSGADYVKFQTFKARNLVSNSASKANYQIQNSADSKESQLQMLQKLELTEADHQNIIEDCKHKKIKFFSTAFDLESLTYLSSLGLDLVKVPSGEITNLPYLRFAAILFKKVILSTGMATIKEIKKALDVFLKAGISKENITILHCNTEYPTPMADVNLKAMLHIKKKFNTKVGYSDHTLGIEVPIAAAALGASIIEKHFTLDKNMVGPDHKASLEPKELQKMILSIRNIEKAISGSEKKEPSPSELKNIAIARKSIVAKTNICKGEVFTEKNITTKRPGNGISPMLWDKVLGKKAKKDFNQDEIIKI